MQISDTVRSIPEALSIYINQLVYALKRKGMDVITLSLGEAYFEIPLFDFNALPVERGYHYSESRGVPELRQKIAQYYDKHYYADVNWDDEVLISAGSKPIIYMAMQAVLNPGDEVLIHEPAWLSYQEQVKLTGSTPRFIPYDCPVAGFHQHFTDKTRLLIINNPNNPAGRVYTKDELASIYAQCRPKGIYVLVDEAYSDFLLDEPFYSIINVVPDKDGVIVVNSLSKNMGMSGWRIGYVISSKEVIYAILKLNQHLITCGPTLLMLYVNQYFDDIISITLPQAQDVVRKRRRVEQMMDRLQLQYLPGSATFYLFLNIGDYSGSSLDLAMYLLFKHGIATVPGSAYGASTERFLRVGVGTESEERMEQALQIIKDVINENRYDDTFVTAQLKKLGYERFQS